MRISTLAPAALLLSLFTLSAQAADLNALSGALSAQLGGGNAGDCQQQPKDLQAKIDAANAKNDLLKVRAYETALEPTSLRRILQQTRRQPGKSRRQAAEAAGQG